MTAYSDILQDADSIAFTMDHIRRVAYAAEVRWENATRLGANLATAATSYLTAEYGGVSRETSETNIRKAMRALEDAIQEYRTAEAGNFWREIEVAETEWDRGFKAGEAAEASRWEARTCG